MLMLYKEGDCAARRDVHVRIRSTRHGPIIVGREALVSVHIGTVRFNTDVSYSFASRVIKPRLGG
jgi:hypothetical protein